VTKKLKIIAKGFESYTGPLGVYDFVDGVSLIEIPRAERDRISCSMLCVEIDADGVESPAGAPHRMATMRDVQIDHIEPLQRMTEAEKRAEIMGAINEADSSKDRTVRTRTELEEILSGPGVDALRAVGQLWNVKARGAVELIERILEAQELWSSKAAARHAARIARAEAELGDLGLPETPSEPVVPDTPDDETAKMLQAAMTGNLSGAINAPETEQTPKPAKGKAPKASKE